MLEQRTPMRCFRRLLTLAVAILALLPTASRAGVTPEGTGLLMGDRYAFSATAPEGWVLDNVSGIRQGLFMVYYPRGQTWRDSPVIAYGRARPKSTNVSGVEAQVADTLADLRHAGSVNSTVMRQPSLHTAGGTEIELYFFQGDKWGNHEAAGYVDEPETVNFIVLNARNREDFERYLPDFKRLLLSYRNKRDAEGGDMFAALREQALDMEKDPARKTYKGEALARLAQPMAQALAVCTEGAEAGDRIEALFPILPDGTIETAYLRESTPASRCFASDVLRSTVPGHHFDAFLLHVEIRMK